MTAGGGGGSGVGRPHATVAVGTSPAGGGAGPVPVPRRRGAWERAMDVGRRVARSRPAAFGTLIVTLMLVLAAVGPSVAPHDPIRGALAHRLQPPSREYPLGTDALGRDLLSRMLYGARIAFAVGFIATAIAGVVGTTLGLVSGYYSGAVDRIIMGFTDILLAFPYLLLALIIVAVLGANLTNAMGAVAVVYIPQYIRLVRGTVLGVKARGYVLAARAAGASNARMVVRHVLLNSLAPIIVQSSLSFGSAIVATATLSFLGLGAQPPTPEWGSILNAGREYIRIAPWTTTFPGLAILLTAIGCNLLGDGLRDALDPRLKTQ